METIKLDNKFTMTIPDGWVVESVLPKKIVLKLDNPKKDIEDETKKELPKTWEGCIAVLVDEGRLDEETIAGVSPRLYVPKEFSKPLQALSKLLVCREVWRQGWKPDYKGTCCTIEYIGGKVFKSHAKAANKIISFQSDEIRDQFLDNFNNLIEEAKELI